MAVDSTEKDRATAFILYVHSGLHAGPEVLFMCAIAWSKISTEQQWLTFNGGWAQKNG